MGRSLPVAVAVVAVVIVCCSGLCRAERLGARECEDLGFTGLALCSDCNALSEFVKDQGTRGSFPSDLRAAAARTLCAPDKICDLKRGRVAIGVT